MCQFSTGITRFKNLKSLTKVLTIFTFILFSIRGFAQLPPGEFGINNGGIYTPQYLVENVLIGQGVEVLNVTFTGNNLGLGYFHGESTLGLASGVVLSSGRCTELDNNEPFLASQSLPPGAGDNDLATVGERCNSEWGYQPSKDATILEFDFIPQSTEVEFRYVFGSEEYASSADPDGFVGEKYNDSFGFFISGPGLSSFGVYSNDARNIALVPNTNEEVCINSINHLTNTEYYYNNIGGTNGVTFGGHTKILIARAQVRACSTYHIKLAIGDISDNIYDSGVFLEANSFSSVGVQTSVAYTHAVVDTAVEACNNATVGFALSGKTLGNMTIHYTIEGTAQNGIDYEHIPDSVVIQSLDSIAFVEVIPISDEIPEDYEYIDFIYNTSLCDPPVMDTTRVWLKDNFPLYNEESGDREIQCDSTATLYIGATMGQMPYTYIWSNGDTTDIIQVSPDTTTVYNYSVTDVCGHNITGDLTVTVVPPTALVPNSPIDMCLGISTTLSVEGGNFWKWSSNPYDPSLEPVDTLQYPTVSPTDTTIYTVIVTDSCGNSDTAYITVNVGDIVAIASTLTPVICTGQSAILEANFVQDATYQWFDEFGTLVGTERVIEVYPPADISYKVVITHTICGIVREDWIDIGVTQMFLTTSNDTIVCPLEEVQLSSSSSLGAGVFVWEDETGNIIGNSSIVTVYPSEPGMYIVTVTDGCTKRDTVFVDVFPLPNVTASADAPSICPEESVTLEAVGNANIYLWTADPFDNTLTGQENSIAPTVTPLVDTKYTLTGTSVDGCISSSDIVITIKDVKNAEFMSSSPSACENDNILFTYTGNANTSANYRWDFDGVIRTGQGPINFNWTGSGTKTVTLVVTQDLCVSDPVTHSVEIKPKPVVDFTYGNTEGCVPLTVDFTDASTNTTPDVSFLWDFGAAGTSDKQSPSMEFTAPGKYDVSLKVTNPGCETTYSVPMLVDAWPVPVAGYSANPPKVSMKNPVITFTSTSTGDNLTYQWNTGDGFVYDTSVFVHTYADSGIYQVELVVENSYGCTNVFTDEVIVTARYMLRIPTAFTPNGDGLNDVFGITGNGVKKFSVSIYNRWGSLIFNSNNINVSWDGKINGQPAEPGLYVYKTFFMDENDEVSEQTGSFLLVK